MRHLPIGNDDPAGGGGVDLNQRLATKDRGGEFTPPGARGDGKEAAV
jgi:hypothetical protein